MRMYFNSDKAWTYLKKYGKIATLRDASRSERSSRVSIWRNGKDTGLRGYRTCIPYMAYNKLVNFVPDVANIADFYVSMSGFDSLIEWLKEVQKFGNPKLLRMFIVELDSDAPSI